MQITNETLTRNEMVVYDLIAASSAGRAMTDLRVLARGRGLNISAVGEALASLLQGGSITREGTVYRSV